MRITIVADSATPAEVMALTRAFQRAVKHDGLPKQVTTDPTIKVVGSAMTWTSPAMHLSTATAILRKNEVQVAEETGGDVEGCDCGMADKGAPGHEHALVGIIKAGGTVYADEFLVEDKRSVLADETHAWFLNEDGEPYMYERADQQAEFPNDPPDAYLDYYSARAASNTVK